MNHFTPIFRSLAAVVIILIPNLFVYADSVIEFEVKKTEVDFSGGKIKNRQTEKDNMTVYLGKDYFYTVDKDGKSIYDFKNKKITRINLEKKEFQKYSLYTLIGFRALELENRLKVFDLFQGKNRNILLEPVMLEHIFSIPTGRADDGVTKAQASGYVNYWFKKSPLASIMQSGKSLSGDDQTGFIRFLRYTLGGHNEILNGIKNSGKVPDKFTIFKYDQKNLRVEYVVKSIREGNNGVISLEGLSPAELSQQPNDFYSLISGINTNNKETIKQKIASIEVDIQGALDNKSYLEALLGCLESGLYNAVFNIDICQNNITDIQSDDNARKLFTYLSPGDQISPEEALKEFKNLEQYSGEKAYILWVFEADMLSRMNKKREALGMFYKALKENPYIAGIYKDIGEIFYNNYNTDLAWMCWDTGRSIFPDHSMLKPVAELEENIIKKYPDYF